MYIKAIHGRVTSEIMNQIKLELNHLKTIKCFERKKGHVIMG